MVTEIPHPKEPSCKFMTVDLGPSEELTTNESAEIYCQP